MRYLFALLANILLINWALAQCTVSSAVSIPVDSGVLNVKDPQFGAVGDGVADDTNAILKAIAFKSMAPALGQPWRTNTVYLPRGTYLVSKTIEKILSRQSMSADSAGNCQTDTCYESGLILIGDGVDKTIIKLKDNIFQDISKLTPVIRTASSFFDPTNNFNHLIGEGNDAYFNYIENLSVDVGLNNPAAIGIDYLANNGGAIRNVKINADTSSGQTGISMLRSATGPAIIENVVVNGFTIGIDVSGLAYTMNLNHVRLQNQTAIGLQSRQHSLTIENLEIVDAALPLNAIGTESMTVLVGGMISTTNQTLSTSDAFKNEGIAHIRDVSISGYKSFLGATDSTINSVFNQNVRLGNSKASFSIAHIEQPIIDAEPDISKWANVQSFGAVADGDTDATVAIKAALNFGASTIYFPTGIYRLNDSLVVPSTVKVIKGFNSVIRPCSYGVYACNKQTVARSNFGHGEGLFKLQPTLTPLLIEKLHIDNQGLGDQVGFEVSGGTKTVMLRDVFSSGAVLQRDVNGAPFVINNYAGGALNTSGLNPVTARQLDIENQYPAITNQTSPLLIYGLKTEANITLANTLLQGVTEILGGLSYIVNLGGNPASAMLKSTDSKNLIAIADMSFLNGVSYSTILDSTHDQNHVAVQSSQFPVRAFGHSIPVLIDPSE